MVCWLCLYTCLLTKNILNKLFLIWPGVASNTNLPKAYKSMKTCTEVRWCQWFCRPAKTLPTTASYDFLICFDFGRNRTKNQVLCEWRSIAGHAPSHWWLFWILAVGHAPFATVATDRTFVEKKHLRKLSGNRSFVKALRWVFGRTFGCRLSCFVEVFAFATLLGVVLGFWLDTGHSRHTGKTDDRKERRII